VTSAPTSAFALPDRLAAKSDPALISVDEQHFADLEAALARTTAELEARITAARRTAGGTGQEAMDRDLEVHRLTARLRTLRRFSLDLCLGRMVIEGESEPVYVGRLGLADGAGGRLLVDWRSPAAEPFFAATHAHPMGLLSRRRYRWTGGRVTDYWDEVFTREGLAQHAALDDQSSFLASLGDSRSGRMRDVLATIQADQDAIIRAPSRGSLVVDGGPGTGKTVVALHRAAYLLYADPRLREGRGGVLVVGPSRPYLSYVADVLPSLGEEGVRTCTLRDLVPHGASVAPEPDLEVARLKSTAAMVSAIEPAVALYEEPPDRGLEISTPYGDVWVSPHDWAEAFGSADPGTPHNDARDEVRDELVTILLDKVRLDDAGAREHEVRRALAQSPELVDALGGAWPLIQPEDLVGDLWSVPAYLRRCAPWLSPDEVRLLQRAEPAAWTLEDLPLLDAARLRLGDPDASRRRRREVAARTAEREERSRVVDHLIATDDSEMMLMSMLRGQDLRSALDDPDVVPRADRDALAGPFAHVVVDEAQELTDAQWQMLLARCPSRSFTVVGDRAQARHGYVVSWRDGLARAGLTEIRESSLTINYRTPEEVMTYAEPVIRAVIPDANVPTSVRRSGVEVQLGRVGDLDEVVATWLATRADGTACVIGEPSYPDSTRVRSLTPVLAKGLEFDLVVVVEPASWGEGVEGAVDRYVAMTRATQQLVVLSG
jgi:hypothetical protein